MPRGAPLGPRLPRRVTALGKSRAVLQVAAYMIGTMLNNERNRHGLTQDELGRRAGIAQEDISIIENGSVPSRVADAQIDVLFRQINLGNATGHAAFLKWWRDNAEKLRA